MALELCKACNAQLTTADWEAGRCTQCGCATFTIRLGVVEAMWNGERVVLEDTITGDVIELTRNSVKRLAKFTRV